MRFVLASLALVLGLIAPAYASTVHVLNVKGIINNGTARYVERGLDAAAAQGAGLAVITLDTPGGLLQATREIVQHMNKSKVPVAVYVTPNGASATSAGTIITMAAHFAAMAPGTNIGAAHPVGGQGEDIKGTLGEKAVNDTVAFIKAQATLHKRNAEWAEQAIRKSVSATSDEAVRLGVVDFLATDLNDLRAKIEKKAPELKLDAGQAHVDIPMTTAERFLTFIGDPNVSYLLMAAGGLGIYMELQAPGISFPGILGAICLILGFISLSTLPVNYGAVALIMLGLGLFVAEIYVTSWGLLTVGGIVSLVVGALLLMDPSTGDLHLSLALVLPTVAAIGLISATIGYIIFKSRKNTYKGLINFSGLKGVIEPVGKCLVQGELWDFDLADASKPIHVGDRVEIVDRQGMRLRVRPIQ